MSEAASVLTRLRTARTGWQIGWMSAAAVALVAVLSALLISATGGSPWDSLVAVYKGAVGSPTAWTNTLLNAAPLLVVAAGVCVAGRSGTFSIGQEGQVLIGAMVAAAVTLKVPLVGPVALTLAILAAAAAGGLWVSLSSLMYKISGVNVVLSTLLMNFVAAQVITFSVNQSWLLQEDSVGGLTPSPESNQIPDAARLGAIGNYPNLQLSFGVFIAVGLTLAVAVVLNRTRWGFRLTMLGKNKSVAKHVGIRIGGLGALALVISGAFAGIAGAMLVSSPVGNYRVQPGMSLLFGWDGLLVALVARERPLLCIPFALLFGMLRSGGNFIAATGVPSYIVDVVKALLVVAFVAPPAIAELRRMRASSRAAANGDAADAKVEVAA